MTIDQAIAGASNILVAVLAARVLDVASFGLFALVFIGYVAAQVAARAVVCDPLLVHPDEAEARTGEVLGTGLVVGLALSLVILVAALVSYLWDAELGNAMLVLAICMPGLALQDLGRYLGFALQQPVRALALDVAWLGVLCVAAVALALSSTESLVWFIVAWAGAGAVTGLAVPVQYRSRGVRPGLSWLRTTWSYSWRYLVAATASQVAILAVSLAVGLIAGAKALGAVRGAQLLWRPFQTFQFAAVAGGIGEISRLDDRGAVQRHVNRTTVLTTGVAVVNAAVLLLLPDALGRQVLGETWDHTVPLLVPAALQIVLVSLMSGVRAGLFGLRAVRTTTALDVSGTAVLFVVVVAGALVDGAVGAMWGLAAGQAVVATAWWTAYALRQ